ncbi:MAG: class I SAM-dependent methyltransferase [Arenicellales bacterium]
MIELVVRVAYSLLNEVPVALGLPSVYKSYCRVCGRRSRRGRPWKLADGLVDSWQIDSRWRRLIERREGLGCDACGSVSRFRYLARVIMEAFGALDLGYDSFSDYAKSLHFRRLRVAEVNGCGALHGYLKLNPELAYSEYGSEDPAIPSEDLAHLSYRDREFDLVLTSDTLEHVPELSTALGEIERVLKPGGRHIFTVPVVWDGRKTRRRAELDRGQVVHLVPPSYHGVWDAQSPDRLVFHEFGEDALDYLQTPGTEISVRQHPGNPSMTVFVAAKLKDDEHPRPADG